MCVPHKSSQLPNSFTAELPEAGSQGNLKLLKFYCRSTTTTRPHNLPAGVARECFVNLSQSLHTHRAYVYAPSSRMSRWTSTNMLPTAETKLPAKPLAQIIIFVLCCEGGGALSGVGKPIRRRAQINLQHPRRIGAPASYYMWSIFIQYTAWPGFWSCCCCGNSRGLVAIHL